MKSKVGAVVLACCFLLAVVPASAMAGSISGKLTDAVTGAPVTDFTVCAEGGPAGYCIGVPENGEYTISNLDPDEYRVSFRPYSGNNYIERYWGGAEFSDAEMIDLQQDEDLTGIDAILEEGAEVTGTVLGPGEIGPLEEVQACVQELFGHEYERCEPTDSEGHYLISGLRAGRYTLSFEPPSWSGLEYAPRYYDEKAFPDEAEEFELTTGEVLTADAAMTQAGMVEGTVTGEGKPLEWAWVCAYTLDQHRVGCTPTDETGHYEYHGLPDGSYVLEFEYVDFETRFSGGAADFGDATPVQVQGGSASTENMELPSPPGIAGTVIDAETGEPLTGVRVCAYPESFSHGTSCVSSGFDDGEYRITELEPDNYTIEFEGEGYARQWYDGVSSEAAATPVTVSGAMVTGIDAELAPGGSIAGHVTLASSGAKLSSIKACALLANGTEVGCDSTSSNGLYEIDSIPIGDYKVRFTRSSYVTQYYNTKATLGEAEDVTVEAGATTSGIDAAMVKLEKPANLMLPELTGVGKVGETLSCSDGTWSNNPTSLEYYWYRNGKEIHGAEDNTYTLTSSDAGKVIGCGTQGINGAGASSVAKSPTTLSIPSLRQLTVTRDGAGSGAVTSSPAGIDCGATCSASAYEGEAFTLSATAVAHSEFAGWSGGGCSGTASCVVTLAGANASVTASFAPITHDVSVAVAGGGSVTAGSGAISGCAKSGGTCSGPYDEGSEVVLTATANAHHAFAGWTGCMSSTGTECTVAVDGAEEVTATFAPITHQLSVTKGGAGSGAVTSAPGGIDCGSTCAASFDEGSSIMLTATPAAHSEFVGWSGGGCTGTSACSLALGADTSVSADFAPITHDVSVDVTGGGSVSADGGAISDCSESAGTCSGSYDEGTYVTLTATPSAHHAFAGWTGCTSVASDLCTVEVEGAADVTATFVPVTHQLSVGKSGDGSGTVTSSPAGIDCGSLCSFTVDEGATVTLTALASEESEFTGWSGGGCAGTGSCQVTVGSDTSVVAGFAKKPVSGGGSETPVTPSVGPPVSPAPAPTLPAPTAASKPLRCKKGFQKKRIHGKSRCVKVKKSGKRHRKHG